MNLLIVFATALEAAALLEQAVPLSDTLFSSPYGTICLCGMGSAHIAERLEPLLPTCDAIWNFGFAGALHPELPIGMLCSVAIAGRECIAHEGMRLVTVDAPLHDPAERDRLALDWDLVDMEGEAIAALAKRYGKPLKMVKVVSDNANAQTSQTILAKAPMLSQILLEAIFTSMNALPHASEVGAAFEEF